MAEEIEMKRFILTFFLGVFICLGIATGSGVAQLEGSSGGRSSVAPIGNETGRRVTEGLSYQEQNMLIGRYCFRCHNDALMTAGLSLESFDASRAGDQAEIAEKMIRKLQAGMMPPPVAQRPDAATYRALITALETTVDIAAAANPIRVADLSSVSIAPSMNALFTIYSNLRSMLETGFRLTP